MQLERGFGGAAPVVFARIRIAKYRQRTVTLNARDSPAVPVDDLMAQVP